MVWVNVTSFLSFWIGSNWGWSLKALFQIMDPMGATSTLVKANEVLWVMETCRIFGICWTRLCRKKHWHFNSSHLSSVVSNDGLSFFTKLRRLHWCHHFLQAKGKVLLKGSYSLSFSVCALIHTQTRAEAVCSFLDHLGACRMLELLMLIRKISLRQNEITKFPSSVG